MLNRLANLAGGHPKRVLIFAGLFFLLAGALGSGVADRLDPYGADDPDKEAFIAKEKLEGAGYRDAQAVILIHDTDPTTPAGAERVSEVGKQVAEVEGVRGVSGFAETKSNAFVSKDGRSTYLAVQFEGTEDDTLQDTAEALVSEFEGEDNILVGGNAVAQQQINENVESDLQRAELLAFPILFLLSLLFFRSLVAAALPLLIGGLAIVSTFLLLTVASELGSISIFALNLVTGLGLGLAIDYSLFVVSRYREEIAKSGAGIEALRRTMATAGRTVAYSSVTVAGALAALAIFPQRFLYSMGIGGALVALAAALISLTVLPAVLALLGERVNSLSPNFLQRRAEADSRPASEGFWYRLSRTIMRIPGRIAFASATFLIVLGIPFFNINFTSVDAQVLPEDTSARMVDNELRSEFPPFHDSPVQVYAEGSAAEVKAIAGEAGRLDGVAEVLPPQRLEGDAWAIEVVSTNAPLADRSQDLVADLRGIESSALVTGFTANFVDLQDSLVEHLPLVLAMVCLVTFIVLFLMTGSVVLPVKQLLMNFLGLSAVFGILVLIFQDGRFEGLLGYDSQGGLESTQPLLLFAVAFGLSTDYGVFLLSRIKEARDGGASDSESVAIGLERTGRIVTAAALLFCIAIGSFVTSEIIFIKQVGLGTALAVIIDATIIRALLVPSLMELLGKWNWWAPAPLRRLHGRIGLSEG
ncbi:MAG: putative drug exporter of the superfamily [Solirubrobacterales bacterium]|jgi:RND superfamily putative drug exporter|nr:putative drug exporter of the superfamily [Solirubrobacterales bacterium]